MAKERRLERKPEEVAKPDDKPGVPYNEFPPGF